MKAIVFTAPEHLEVAETPDPICGPEDVIVHVAAAGICGTDLHIYRNEYFSSFPLIAGHEFCGVITEVGRDVRGLSAGVRIAVDPNLYCGECEFCRSLHGNQCTDLQAVGVTRNGAFGQYVAVPATACYRLPDGLSDLEGASVEPVACVVQAMGRMSIGPGDRALVFGAGPMGLILTQALRHRGASDVVVVDQKANRLDLALTIGAGSALVSGVDLKPRLNALAPRGFHIVVDATGVPSVIEDAFSYLRPHGQFLQFGVAPNHSSVKVNPYDIFRNDWSIIGSFALNHTFEAAIAWLSAGVIDVRPSVSHQVPLDEFPRAFASFAKGETLKVQVLPSA